MIDDWLINRNANYLLVCDGVDKLLNDTNNGETGGPLNIRGFLEDLFQTTEEKAPKRGQRPT